MYTFMFIEPHTQVLDMASKSGVLPTYASAHLGIQKTTTTRMSGDFHQQLSKRNRQQWHCEAVSSLQGENCYNNEW